MNMQQGNKDNIVNISKFKHKQDPLNIYTMSLIDIGLPQDIMDLSAQNVLWDNSRIDPVMYNQAQSNIIRYDVVYEHLCEDKSLIRKIFDWFMVKGL